MNTSNSWRRVAAAGVLVAGVLGAGLGSPSSTGAQEPPVEEPPPPVLPGGYDLAPLPGFEEYAGCPLVSEGSIRLCIAATVSGDLQLGGVGGAVDDLTMVMGAGATLGGDTVLVPAAAADGAPAVVQVPGGLLGIPELQPLLALDLLQLLSLSATPEMGELAHTGLDTMLASLLYNAAFGGIPAVLEGDDPIALPGVGEPFCPPGPCATVVPEVQLEMPLALTLNNLLLGTDCRIGPIEVAVTNGTTNPPEGVTPLTGSSGAVVYNGMPTGLREFHVDGIELVGNAFEVPESDCPGILGAGELVGSLAGVNPFDALIGSAAGLPSGAGQNSAELTLDLHVAYQGDVYGAAFGLSDTALDFGSVPVGTIAEQTFTVTNLRNAPRTFTASDPAGSSRMTVDDSGCVDVAAGGSCEVTVGFAPINTSPRSGNTKISSPPDTVGPPPISGFTDRVSLTGVGV